MTEAPAPAPSGIEEQVERWRRELLARAGVAPDDVDELEDHLRGHIGALTKLGLTPDEAFLVAVQRVGSQHAIAADLAREHSGRLWKQHVSVRDSAADGSTSGLLPMLGFAAIAGLVVKFPVTYALQHDDAPFFLLVATLLLLSAVVAAFLIWQRRSPVLAAAAAVTVTLGVFALTQAFYPYVDPFHTRLLATMHIPIAVAVLLGAVYLGTQWREVDRWLDYVRFLGELFIYLVLIALGGGVLVGLTGGVFSLVGIDPRVIITEWIVPLGIGGAVIVAAWLVEAKKSVLENMAPVLAAVFTPLFTLLLLGFLGAMLVTGRIVDANRDVLIIIDLVLVVVLGLHLFSVSARRDNAPVGWSDRLQLVLVAAALILDVVVLSAMAGRIGEYGATPNKLAALGENLVLAGALAGSAWYLVAFLRGKRPFVALERWLVRSLYVIGAWAVIVILVFPPLFAFR